MLLYIQSGVLTLASFNNTLGGDYVPKHNNPIEGQITFDELREDQERTDQLKRPASRIARANTLLDLIRQINFGNMYRGATGHYGETSPNFDFKKAYGTRITRSGEVRMGKSYESVHRQGEAAHDRARASAGHACEICEYSADCVLKGRLYEKLRYPDQSKARGVLERRMRAVVDSGGTKTMSCEKAINLPRPKKTDWDY